MNTGVVGSVELSSRDTTGHRVSGASDAEVDALRVELRTADIASGVEGEDLMAEDVVSRLYVGRNSDPPGKAIVDKFVGGPLIMTMLVVSHVLSPCTQRDCETRTYPVFPPPSPNRI